jgi:hypothetical protein
MCKKKAARDERLSIDVKQSGQLPNLYSFEIHTRTLTPSLVAGV